MSIHAANGETEADRERNAGARAILRSMAEASKSDIVSTILRSDIAAIEFAPSLTGATMILHVTGDAAGKLAKFRLSLYAAARGIFSETGLAIEELEVIPLSPESKQRIAQNEAIRSAIERAGCPPVNLLAHVQAHIETPAGR